VGYIPIHKTHECIKVKRIKPLVWILIAAALVRLYYIFTFDYISPDGVQYVHIGYNLWHDFTYTSGGAMFPDIIQPPFYPFVAGFFSLFLPVMIAGKIASLIAGLVLIGIVHRFLSRVANPGVALTGAVLTAVHPGLIAVSSQVATESWYILFVALLIYDGWFFIKVPSSPVAFRLALWIVLGFLTRPEMLVFALFFIGGVIIVFWVSRTKRFLAPLLSLMVPVFVGIMAYAGFVSADLGYFTLSPKINFVRIQSKLAGIARNEHPDFSALPPKVAAFRAFYALTADHGQLLSEALLFKKPQAMNWLENHRLLTKKFNAVGLLKNVGLNAINVLRKILTGIGLPVLYALLAFLGFFILFKRQRLAVAFLLTMCLPLSMYLFVHVEDRFLLGSWPMFIWPGAVFLHSSYLKLRKRLSYHFALALVVVVLLVFSGQAYHKMDKGFHSTEHYQALARGVETFVPPSAIVAAKHPQTAFFLDAKYRALPFASVSKLLVYSQKQNVDFIILDEKDLILNPAWKKMTSSSPGYLKLINQGRVDGTSYWLFHLNRKEG